MLPDFGRLDCDCEAVLEHDGEWRRLTRVRRKGSVIQVRLMPLELLASMTRPGDLKVIIAIRQTRGIRRAVKGPRRRLEAAGRKNTASAVALVSILKSALSTESSGVTEESCAKGDTGVTSFIGNGGERSM